MDQARLVESCLSGRLDEASSLLSPHEWFRKLLALRADKAVADVGDQHPSQSMPPPQTEWVNAVEAPSGTTTKLPH